MIIIPDIRPQILTMDILKDMKAETIFAHGYMEHIHPWFNNLSAETPPHINTIGIITTYWI